MRLRHRDGTVVHLAYCTNVHPAESVVGIRDQLRRFAGPVRERLGVERLGVGLWIPAGAAADLARSDRELGELRADLTRLGLEVVTLNAFPYAAFHAPVVKQAVYHPDWTDDARLSYTLDCARVLAALLPDDAARGSISTLPLAWREPWSPKVAAAAHEQLDRLAEGLALLAEETGRTVRVALEPEPGCVVDTVADAAEHLAAVASEHVGICLDTCHLATSFETTAVALGQLEAAGLQVVKSQVSAALHADDPTDPATRAALERFVEDRFLHQVRARNGVVRGVDDLPDALDAKDELPGEWRVHFHVPLHAEPDAPLRSTRDELVHSLADLVGGEHPRTDHLELETYTWSVLPEGRRPQDDEGLVEGLAAELRWVADQLADQGLEVL